ncbi:MAG: hypothetical protein ACYTGZ_16020 [Planctomycetota bacterium]
MRSIQSATLFFAAMTAFLHVACGNSPIKRGGRDVPGVLSFAQVNSLEQGKPLSEVVRELGPPGDRMTKEGRVVALAYRAENGQGAVGELRIGFDSEQKIVRWTLSGRTKSAPDK